MKNLSWVEDACVKADSYLIEGNSVECDRLRKKVWDFYKKMEKKPAELLQVIEILSNSKYDTVRRLNATEALRRNIDRNKNIEILRNLANKKTPYLGLVSLEAEIALLMYDNSNN